MVITSVPLIPGEYSVEVQLKDGPQTVDFVRDAAIFSVASTDALGSGYQFIPQDGFFHVPWEWELRPSPSEGGTGPEHVAELLRAEA